MSEEQAAGPEYAAWVPTSSGHHSFSAVGTYLVRDAVCYNNMDRRTLREPLLGVVAAQRRISRDTSPILRWIARWLEPLLLFLMRKRSLEDLPESLAVWIPVGYVQHFFLVGSPRQAASPYFDSGQALRHRDDRRGVMEGRVYIVLEEEDRRRRRDQNEVLRKLFADIEAKNHVYGKDGPEEGWRERLAVRIAAPVSHVELGFRLYRTGELRLQFLRQPGGKAEADVVAEIFSRHAYYFVRDCAHRHYHHKQTDDQLLPAIRTDLYGHEEGETAWRREVLWALTRTAGQYRRENYLSARRQSLGVLAYADAFQATLARVRRRDDRPEHHFIDPSLASFDFGHQKASTQVANDVTIWWRQGAWAAIGFGFATLLSLLGIWATIGRLPASGAWTPSPAALWVIEVFYTDPLPFVVAALGLIYVLWDATYGDRSAYEFLFRTFLAVSWPSKEPGIHAQRRLYWVTFFLALIILLILDLVLQVRL